MKPTFARFGVLVAFALAAGPTFAACDSYHDLLPFVPASGWPNGWQGFVRIDNAFNRAEDVRFIATDDTGNSYSLTVEVGANESLHFNSEDLEYGNSAKGGLQGTLTGPVGHWRLCFTDLLFATATSYIRTGDGFLTAMTLIVEGEDFGCEIRCPEWRVPIFNPASNENQVSYLRIVNNSDVHKAIAIFGVRSDGEHNRDADDELRSVGGFIRAREVVEITSQQLESGVRVPLERCNPSNAADCLDSTGSLGPAIGKWSLLVTELFEEPAEELVVMNLMRTPTGHVTNLSAGGNDAWIRR